MLYGRKQLQDGEKPLGNFEFWNVFEPSQQYLGNYSRIVHVENCHKLFTVTKKSHPLTNNFLIRKH